MAQQPEESWQFRTSLGGRNGRGDRNQVLWMQFLMFEPRGICIDYSRISNCPSNCHSPVEALAASTHEPLLARSGNPPRGDSSYSRGTSNLRTGQHGSQSLTRPLARLRAETCFGTTRRRARAGGTNHPSPIGSRRNHVTGPPVLLGLVNSSRPRSPARLRVRGSGAASPHASRNEARARLVSERL